jgi:hypothetical protein
VFGSNSGTPLWIWHPLEMAKFRWMLLPLAGWTPSEKKQSVPGRKAPFAFWPFFPADEGKKKRAFG